MRFKVARTSTHGEQPCPESVAGTIEVWDRRTFASPEEHDAKSATLPGLHLGRWHEKGTEHGYWQREGKRGIQRRLADREVWYVEIESLEALMAFGERHGDVILTTASDDGHTPTLEIYDAYRE